jgi:hypothetical protein
MNRHHLRGVLRRWQDVLGLAGVRDEARLKDLPDEEAEAWRAFWADVAAHLKRLDEED